MTSAPLLARRSFQHPRPKTLPFEVVKTWKSAHKSSDEQQPGERRAREASWCCPALPARALDSGVRCLSQRLSSAPAAGVAARGTVFSFDSGAHGSVKALTTAPALTPRAPKLQDGSVGTPGQTGTTFIFVKAFHEGDCAMMRLKRHLNSDEVGDAHVCVCVLDVRASRPDLAAHNSCATCLEPGTNLARVLRRAESSRQCTCAYHIHLLHPLCAPLSCAERYLRLRKPRRPAAGRVPAGRTGLCAHHVAGPQRCVSCGARATTQEQHKTRSPQLCSSAARIENGACPPDPLARTLALLDTYTPTCIFVQSLAVSWWWPPTPNFLLAYLTRH